MTRRKVAAALLLFALLSNTFPVAVPAQTPQPTPDAVERIKDEGVNRSRLMETVEHITDVIGPRLTGSAALRRANEWTRERLTQYGLTGAHLEPWGPFGRGWTLKRFSAEVVAPQAFPLLAYPRAWSPGLDAPLTADVILVDANNDAELQKYKGTLRGKIVLAGEVRELKPRFEPTARRLNEKQLLELADAPDPSLLPPRPQRQRTPEQIEAAKFNDRKTQFYYEEGAALLVGSSPAGDGGTLQFVQQAFVPQPFDTPFDKRVWPWQKDSPKLIPQMALSNDHYNRLARMIHKGERVRMSVNLQAEFDDSDQMSYNTVAEIAGTDLKDEVVMLGAHLDSWHTATGATDNAAGVGVMMEAVRILKALNLQPRRTIRVALWSGEEQGLFGSRSYVREHFGGIPETFGGPQTPTKPEHERLNVYFNVDSGTGAIRGIFLQGNEALRPVFSRWLMPFREFKVGQTTYNASTVTASNTDGSDFLSFDAAGLNGFDFIQDDMEYETRTWHSSQDTFDRLVEDDLKEAACIVAAFAYNAATMDGKLPRKQRQK
jgi:hypothetical protein